jgi:hypothetical protein
MAKMINDDEEQYICRWFTEWEMVEIPSLQECLSCGGYGPGGYECAFCWTTDHPTVKENEPTTIIVCLKYYMKNRRVHPRDTHLKFAWYIYTWYIMELAIEEKMWLMSIAERGSDNHPIRLGICIAGQSSNNDE